MALTEPNQLVERVAASAGFARAPAIRKLLLYLWEHRADDVSEYAIALDVLNKREDFDPKVDASVRVHLSRLRQKLREYAETDGSDLPMRLVVPAGTQRLQIEEAPRPQLPPSPLATKVRRFWAPVLAACLAVVCGVLWVQYVGVRQELDRARGNLQLPEIWQTILKPGRLTRVIYPVPIFYQWDSLRVRDVRVSRAEDLASSPNLQPLVERLGKPKISQSYTVGTDALAAVQLTRFLSSHATPMEVSPTSSISPDQFGNEHLVFLGIPPTHARLSAYLDKLSFQLIDGSGSVRDRKPGRGERSEYIPAAADSNHPYVERYGVLAVLPGHSPGTSLMLIISTQTSAIGTLLTAPHGLEELTRHWKAAGEPEHFEAIVHTVMDGATTRNATISAFRTIR